jgi:2-dehydropantoate 2-reductase
VNPGGIVLGAHIGIVGAGPMGSILATHFSHVGHKVTLVDLNINLVNAILENGLCLQKESGEIKVRVHAQTSLEPLYENPPRYLFICVKSIDLHRLIEPLRGFEGISPLFICFQNGLDTEKILTQAFVPHRVFRSVPNLAGMMIEPGVVRESFFHPPNYIGPLCPTSFSLARELASLMTDAGLETVACKCVKDEVWRKSIMNASLMPVSVITGMTMFDIMHTDKTQELVINLLDELLAIAQAEGCNFDSDFHDRAIDYLSKAGDHKTSMLMDYESGRPLEIDFLNLKFQAYAKKHGIHACHNQILSSVVLGLVAHRDRTSRQ